MKVCLREIVQKEIRESSEKESDIRKYFHCNPEVLPIPANSCSDDYVQAVLLWWKNNSQNYPLMSQIARDHLAIPVASVQVERIFSGCRDLYGVRRYSLHANTVKILTQYKSISSAFPDA